MQHPHSLTFGFTIHSVFPASFPLYTDINCVSILKVCLTYYPHLFASSSVSTEVLCSQSKQMFKC